MYPKYLGKYSEFQKKVKLGVLIIQTTWINYVNEDYDQQSTKDKAGIVYITNCRNSHIPGSDHDK